jgi:hypothetical protein
MKRRIPVFVACLLLIAAGLSAQDQAKWTPAAPEPGDTLVITYDPSIGQLPVTADSILMHWGINQTGPGAWRQPPVEVWPPNTRGWSDGKAAHSAMNKLENGKWEITVVTLDTFKTVHICFTDGTNWDSNNGANWDVYLGGGGGPVHMDWISFQAYVDLGPAVQKRGFTYGDTVEVRVGGFNTAAELYRFPLTRVGISSIYRCALLPVLTTMNDTLDYSYFAKKNGKDNWEVFYNFSYAGLNQSEAQYRQVAVTKSAVIVRDTVRSRATDIRRSPFFRNKSVLAQDVTVTLTCDLRPAYWHLKLGGEMLHDIQGLLGVSNPDSVLIHGVAVNGPITGSWSNSLGSDWGAHLMTLENKRMVDDGTNGDAVAGDSVFSITFQFYRDSADVVGQEFKFGLGGGDNEGGYGNNHVENMDDFLAVSTLDAQFGSIDPFFYSEWDFARKRVKTGVAADRVFLPGRPSLAQNYPNPFNPSTTLRYALPSRGPVSLTVFNLKGERVAVLLDGEVLPAGMHAAVWNGTGLNGEAMAAGVYLARLEAGSGVQVRKMLLVK